jgi:hypothetical protein
MITFIETWEQCADKRDARPRWGYQTGTGLIADGGMLMGGASASLCNARIPQVPSIRLGFWYEARLLPPSVTNSSLLHLLSGIGEWNTYNQVGLGHNPDGTLSVFYGPNFSGLGGTTLGNGARVLALNERHWIELEVVLSKTTTGRVELRIDGTPELAFENIRTSYQAGAWVETVSICGGAGVSSHWFGGMYVGDGAEDWLGVSDVARAPIEVPAGAAVAMPFVEAIVPRVGYGGAPPPPPPPAAVSIPAGDYQLTLQPMVGGSAQGDPFVAPITVS